MRKIKDAINSLITKQNKYFKEDIHEIAIHNLLLMKTMCALTIIIYVGYYSVTSLFFKEWLSSPLYGLIIPIMALFFVYAVRKTRGKGENPYTAMRMTYLLYLVTLSYFIVLSIFPHPNVPSIYYHMCILVAPVVFILPIYMHLFTTIVSLVIFYYLVYTFKAPSCWTHELFEATTSAIFAIVIMVFMTQFRLQTEKSTEKYYRLSRMDGLTGLMNKMAGLEAVAEYNCGTKEEQFAIMFLDIDQFKTINDTYGHIEGDRILKEVGEILPRLFRENDIICRFGGDEFLVLMKNIHDIHTVQKKVTNILETAHIMDRHSAGLLTLSIGIYISRQDKDSLDDILEKSDIALYQAKDNGRDQYYIYDEALDGH